MTATSYSEGQAKLKQLSRQHVLDYVHLSGTILKVVYKMMPQVGSLAQDLINDVYLIVWQLPDEKLFDLYLQKQLLNYVALIVIFLVNTKGSLFNKTYETKLIKIDIDETTL